MLVGLVLFVSVLVSVITDSVLKWGSNGPTTAEHHYRRRRRGEDADDDDEHIALTPWAVFNKAANLAKDTVLSAEYKRKSEEARVFVATLEVGTRLTHDFRSAGVVTKIEHKQEIEVHVDFDNGEQHHYKPHSMHKLRLETESTPGEVATTDTVKVVVHTGGEVAAKTNAAHLASGETSTRNPSGTAGNTAPAEIEISCEETKPASDAPGEPSSAVQRAAQPASDTPLVPSPPPSPPVRTTERDASKAGRAVASLANAKRSATASRRMSGSVVFRRAPIVTAVVDGAPTVAQAGLGLTEAVGKVDKRGIGSVVVQGLANGLPFSLVLLFCLTPSLSAAIFRAQSCVGFRSNDATGGSRPDPNPP